MLLILYNSIIPIAWSGHRRLNQFTHLAFLVKTLATLARHPSGLKLFFQRVDELSCRSQRSSSTVGLTVFHSYECSKCIDGMTSLGGGLPEMKSTGREEGSPDSINGHISVTKASLQLEGHWLGFNMERHELRKIYLSKTD